MHLPDYYDDLTAFAVAVGLLGGGLGWWRRGLPRLRQRLARERALDDLLFGRAAVPANPLTGEPARPELKPLGERVGTIEHLLVANGGENNPPTLPDRLASEVGKVTKRLDSIDDRLGEGDQRFDSIEHTLRDVVGHAAEASTQALSTIETAILAQPPADI